MPKYIGTEEQAKKVLGINDFENLSPRKTKRFISLIPRMDKEVATSIIDQFSAEATLAVIDRLHQICDGVLKSNNASQDSVIQSYNIVLDDLREQLKQNALTFEQQRQITQQMVEVVNYIADKDSENKKFLMDFLGKVLSVVGTVVSSVAVAAIIAHSTKSEPKSGEEDKNVP